MEEEYYGDICIYIYIYPDLTGLLVHCLLPHIVEFMFFQDIINILTKCTDSMMIVQIPTKYANEYSVAYE